MIITPEPLAPGRRDSIPEAFTVASSDSAVTQRCVLGSEGTVRAFRAGATALALGTVDPRAKFAVRRWCDERPGAVSFEDGDRRTHGRLTTIGRAADNCKMCKG